MTRFLIPCITLFFSAGALADHHIPGEVSGGIDCTDALNQVIYPECQVTTSEPEPETSCYAAYHPDEGSLEIAWVDVGTAGYSDVVLGAFPTGPLDFRLSAAQPASGDAPAADCRAGFDLSAGVVTVPRVEVQDASGAVTTSYANVRLRLFDPATYTFQVVGAEPVQ